MRQPIAWLLLGVLACDDGDAPRVIGGDAGPTVNDAGQALNDAGQVLDDAGRVLDDAGRVLDDAGRVLDDAGVVLPDEGVDAGLAPDAAPAPCVEIAVDGVLDFDLNPIRVRGAVTLNGAALPADEAPGPVVFTASNGASYAAPIEDGRYEATLAPGTYEITYRANPAPCAGTPAPALPCTGAALHAGLELSADGVLDVDLRAVTVRGRITLNGAALPDEPAGSLQFGGATTPIQDDAYQVRLWPGDYVLEYLEAPGECAEMPCMSGRLQEGLRLAADGVLDVDIPAVTVRGAMTREGQAITAQTPNRGGLTLDRAKGGSAFIPADASFRVVLLPGEFGISWQPAAECAPEPESALPCTGGPLLRDLRLVDDGVLDIDVPVVVVRGTVTHRGGPLPERDRGSLWFRGDAEGQLGLPEADYRFPILPGDYDVLWIGDATTCPAEEASELPCNTGPLRTGVALRQSGVLDLDVPSVRVRGALTLDAGEMPESPAAIRFGDEAGAVLTPAAPGRYDVRLLPGDYAIGWVADGVSCDDDVPCASGPLQASRTLQADGVLDIDVPQVRVRGRVTADGQPLPDPPGALAWALRDGGLGLATDAANHEAVLLPGCYSASWLPGARECTPELPCLPVPLVD